MVKSRRNAPSKTTSVGSNQSWRIWVNQPTFLEDQFPWKCVATFYFLTDALEYIADCQDKGIMVIYQTPAYNSEIRPTDQRVVYKADTA